MPPRRRTLLALFPLLSLACGAPPRPFVPERAGPRPEHSVVYLSSSCSGVLITPRRVLTAAHCVEDPGPWTVRVDGDDGREEVGASTCALHPEAYRGEPRGCGEGRARLRRAHDLALLTLERDVVGAAPLPIVLVEPSLERDWWRGRDVLLYGWDRRPFMVGALTRRGGPNRIVALRPDRVVTEPRDTEGFTTRMGDSGGPALLELGSARHVIGVLYGGPSPASARSIYTPTYAPANARWLLRELGDTFGRDLPEESAARSSVVGVTSPLFPR